MRAASVIQDVPIATAACTSTLKDEESQLYLAWLPSVTLERSGRLEAYLPFLQENRDESLRQKREVKFICELKPSLKFAEYS